MAPHLNDDQTILIATSLSPRDIEAQRKAITSWLELGFQVVIINPEQELEAYSRLFSDCRLEPSGLLDADPSGRRLVPFDQVRQCLVDSPQQRYGILNSDITLRADDTLISSSIPNSLISSLVFGSRIDVPSDSTTVGNVYELGFDFFFFDDMVLNCFPRSEFRLGAPWWDLWVPIVPFLKKIPIKVLTTPFAYHVDHETIWGDEWHGYADHFIGLVADIVKAEGATPEDPWTQISTALMSESVARHVTLTRHATQNETLREVAEISRVFLANMLGTSLPRFLTRTAVNLS